MRFYIAHKYGGDRSNIDRVGEVAKKLQLEHPEHAYFSPLHAFSFLEYNDMPHDDFMEVCYDLSACDALIVASEISNGVQEEIKFAKLVKMEVLRLDENGELQPFTE